jgi:ATP-dependent Clp protease ATP-binding subunit ClpA
MFERFTDQARAAVVQAQHEARSLRHGWIGTEHLLLAVLADESSEVSRALASLGLDAARFREHLVAELGVGVDDGAALRDLGIDLDSVRRRVEERFGPGALDSPPPRRGPRWRRRRASSSACGPPSGHIPFARRAKKSLELALREALAQGSKEITLQHLVLGLMRAEGMASTVVTALGVSPDAVRRAVLDLGRAA